MPKPAKKKVTRKKRAKKKAAPKGLKTAVKRMVKALGRSEVASLFDVTPSTVSRWTSKGPPATRAPSIHQVIGALSVLKAERKARELAEAAAEHRAIKYLHKRGRLSKRQLAGSAKRLKTAQKEVRGKAPKSSLLDELKRLRAKDPTKLDVAKAAHLAKVHRLSLQQVYTVFHYL